MQQPLDRRSSRCRGRLTVTAPRGAAVAADRVAGGDADATQTEIEGENDLGCAPQA